ncbi:DNA glycosylase [Hymenopellis radicata]|nr:DNA glycosylase [Hymenopellis radicata]
MSALPPNNAMLRRSTRLVETVSPFNSSVTLVQIKEESDAEPRPSKRPKTEDSDDDQLATNPTPKRPKASSPKKHPIPQSLATPHPAPDRWRETYAAIKEMRSTFVAPVDTMGCDQAQMRESNPKTLRHPRIPHAVLQTKDEVTDAAVSRLREAVGGALSVDAIIGAEDSVISDAIAKVGFWRRKTVYIKQAAQKLKDDFDSDVPKTVDELCSLPGVGPKMAFLALQIAWNLNHGIGVDVHVHRITNRLGWHKPPTKTPEETRLNLQSWLPTELHPDINHMLVGFGQMICRPVRPKCDECTLSTAGLCPSAQIPKTKSKKLVKASKHAAGPAIEVAIEVSEE